MGAACRPLPPLADGSLSVSSLAVSCRWGRFSGDRQLSTPANTCSRPKAVVGELGKRTFRNVEVTGAARLYRAASVWSAGLGNLFEDITRKNALHFIDTELLIELLLYRRGGARNPYLEFSIQIKCSGSLNTKVCNALVWN